MDDLDGKTYSDLPNDSQEKILDFNLSLVTIDAKINPQFDPIDLFLRLNNKPYPIRENTFEMWNSYIDNEIISKIRVITNKYENWFFSRLKNTRMENEELITTLAYFEYMLDNDDGTYLDIYQRNDKINFRVKSKVDITKVLNTASEIEDTRNEFIKGIKRVELFIKKLKMLLVDKDINNNLDDYLKKELDEIFNITHSKTARRTLQNFYALWYILAGINYEMTKRYRIELKEEISNLFKYTKSVSVAEQNGQGLVIYKEMVSKLLDRYQVVERKVKLAVDDKKGLLNKQKNLCPICNSLLFITDEIDVDHIIPLGIGGSDKFLNLQITHRDCNRRKGVRI